MRTGTSFAAAFDAKLADVESVIGQRITVYPLTPQKWLTAYADTHQSAIATIPLHGEKAERAYWIALHELGHLVNRHPHPTFADSFSGPGPAVYQRELEAWRWAFENSPLPVNEVAVGVASEALSTYISKGRLSVAQREAPTTPDGEWLAAKGVDAWQIVSEGREWIYLAS